MTERTQFEAMLEALINEDKEKAQEIFHNIIVAKSREIYEELLESDFSESKEEGKDDEEEGEEEGEEESTKNEGFPGAEEEEGEEEEEEGEEDDMGGDEEESDDVGGDATDDLIGDIEDDGEEGGEDEGDGAIEDRVMDLEDALEELKAEFEQLMADEENEPEHNDGMQDPDFGADAEMEMGGSMDGSMDGTQPDELAQFMEYVNKVSPPKHGDNGTNTKSIVAGKNDMGGTTANIAKNFSTTKGGTEGGLAKTKPEDLTAGLGEIHNRVDSKAGKKAFTKKEPGHGPEKKGAAPQEDKGAGSVINGAPKRAK